jgi:hypothetical protein
MRIATLRTSLGLKRALMKFRSAEIFGRQYTGRRTDTASTCVRKTRLNWCVALAMRNISYGHSATLENAFQFSDFACYAEITMFQQLGNLFLTGMFRWHLYTFIALDNKVINITRQKRRLIYLLLDITCREFGIIMALSYLSYTISGYIPRAAFFLRCCRWLFR